MTEDQLRAIEARADAAQWALTPSSQPSICEVIADIPELVAEVRRLRSQVDELAELVPVAYMSGKCHGIDFDLTDESDKLTAILNGESEGE